MIALLLVVDAADDAVVGAVEDAAREHYATWARIVRGTWLLYVPAGPRILPDAYDTFGRVTTRNFAVLIVEGADLAAPLHKRADGRLPESTWRWMGDDALRQAPLPFLKIKP